MKSVSIFWFLYARGLLEPTLPGIPMDNCIFRITEWAFYNPPLCTLHMRIVCIWQVLPDFGSLLLYSSNLPAKTLLTFSFPAHFSEVNCVFYMSISINCSSRHRLTPILRYPDPCPGSEVCVESELELIRRQIANAYHLIAFLDLD